MENTMNIIKFDFNEMVALQGNQVMTTSLKVAEYFGRNHKNVLRAIKNLECSDDFTRLNFELCYEINHLQNNKPQPFYKMTKDGFMFLVMGFTGKAAAQIKEAYINAFNWMTEQLIKMQHSYMKQHNDLMLEYMKEKDVASMSGRLLRRWGREKKPELKNRIEKLKQQSQIKLLI